MIRFVLFGFPVHIHWFFWITLAILGGLISSNFTPGEMQKLVMFVLAGLISILVHELGHAFAMRKFGGRAAIVLHSLGGYAVSDKNFSRVQHIVISLAGPVAQILLGVLFNWLLDLRIESMRASGEMIQGSIGIFDLWLSQMTTISLVWGIFNLIPIFPLDGGQTLFYALGPKLQKVTFGLSVILGILIVYLAFKGGLIFAAIMVGILTYENIKRFRGEHASSILFPR